MPPGAKFTLDGAPVREGGFEAVEKVWHCVLPLLATVLEYGLGLQVARRCAGIPRGTARSGG